MLRGTVSMDMEEIFRAIQELKNVDVRTVDPAALAEIDDVAVNTALPYHERMIDYYKQIKNPYCFKHGKTIIKVGFADTNQSLEDRLESYMLSM